MLVQEPLQAAIWHCLNHYAYSDATFLAERLLAEVDTDESLFLLATCYYRSGKLNQAYDVLQCKGLRTQQNRFLMARCCTDLNKFLEAEMILNGGSLDPRKERSIEEVVSDFGDSACFAYKMLSTIYSQTERMTKAIEMDRHSLKLNPLLWNSFEHLCQKGDVPDPNKIFTVNHLDNFNQCHGMNYLLNVVNNINFEPTSSNLIGSTNTGVITPNVPHTPQQSHLHTPPVPSLTVTPLSSTETPLCNLISTPNTNSRYISGISTLNYSADLDSPNKSSLMPPPLRMRKRQTVASSSRNISPTQPDSSSYVPSFGTLLLRCNGSGKKSLNDSVISHSPSLVQLQLNFSSAVELSLGSPVTLQSNSNMEFALTNATNNEQKLSKRSIMAHSKENPLKPNLFAGQSSNLSPSASQIVRRSSRLFGSTQSVKENSKTPNTPSVGSMNIASMKGRVAPKSPSRKTNKARNNGTAKCGADNVFEKNEKNKEILKDEKNVTGTPTHLFTPQNLAALNLGTQAIVMQKTSLEGLMSLLRTLGMSYLEYSRYNCRKSLNILEEVSPHHRNKGWVLGLIGKNYFELGDYKEAKKYFQEVRDHEPYRLDYMEYYSTTLWHLQEEIELSALAQELLRIDKFSPQSWCAAGNCFSLQKEHENAIKFFQRAVQVQPNFAYAYTLLGHEYVMIEELDKALSCFRSAVRIDPRHYNAWYGIGLTYYKQEAFQLTEIYYKKALSINKHSPILMCHVAVVQHSLQKTDQALETLNIAIIAAPKNPLCKFERASILFASERYEEALEELDELKEIVPKEPPVYFLIGKVHNKLNNKNLALMHFSWAMDLDPKGANSQIKDALDPTLNRATQDESSIQPSDDPMQESIAVSNT